MTIDEHNAFPPGDGWTSVVVAEINVLTQIRKVVAAKDGGGRLVRVVRLTPTKGRIRIAGPHTAHEAITRMAAYLGIAVAAAGLALAPAMLMICKTGR